MQTIRLGIAGLGRAFSLMLPTFLADARVQIVAACDPRETARAQFQADFGAPAFDDIDALARRPDIDTIYVASPHQFHAAHTRIAASHGEARARRKANGAVARRMRRHDRRVIWKRTCI